MNDIEIYQKLREFTFSALQLANEENRLPKNKIIIANQSVTRPIKPFVTIELNTFKDNATPISRKEIFGEEQQITEVLLSRTCIATINAYSDLLYQSEIIMNQIYCNFWTGLSNNIFNSELAVRRVLKSVTAIPTPNNSQIESRAYIEIEFGYTTNLRIPAVYATAIHLTNEINNEEFDINLE